jgi:hypothetical protein
MIPEELRKLADLGAKWAMLESCQVLCLPENIFHSSGQLMEASDSINLGKHLKAAGIKCGTSFDLGLQTLILERRADDKWFGTIYIRDKVAVPIVVSVIASLIATGIVAVAKSNAAKSAQKVHLELYIQNTNSVNKISYEGDGDTLVKVLKSLEDGNAK